MKKLVLFAAVIAAISLSACKKEAAPAVEEAPVVEEVVTAVEEVVAVDSAAVETPATEIAQ